MEKYIIKGGRPLLGKVRAESAKNAVLPLFAASILTDEKVEIKNCPQILDVISMAEILKSLGIAVSFSGGNAVIDASGINGFRISENLTKELRSSVFMLGALLSRVKKAEISYPGGCEIGLRPIDLHLKGLKKLGVSVKEENGKIICNAENAKSAEIYLDFPSVGATENLMLASVFLQGETVIKNCAREPEVKDLMDFLNLAGAKISGGGTDTIVICGVKELHGVSYAPISDRIETGTFLLAAAISGGEIEISNAKAENISALIHKLCNNACKIRLDNDIIYLKCGKRFKGFEVDTRPYPGFPTDLQAQSTALATVSRGVSLITENLFEMRFKYAGELKKMGAKIKVCGKTAIVVGVKRLHGATVCAGDLRGGAALVLAGLAAEGVTVVEGARHIDRGYYRLGEKLNSLGASVEKTDSEKL